MMENEIINFTIIEVFEKYDKNKNPLNLSVYDLLPRGIKWNCNGKEYSINNGNKIYALLLKNNKSISIIEKPYNKVENKTYIINGNNEIEFNIRNLLLGNKKITLEYNIRDLYIWEAYYIGNELYYFINTNGSDYRFSFDFETGKIGDLIFSR
jgi:hypothetical protein